MIYIFYKRLDTLKVKKFKRLLKDQNIKFKSICDKYIYKILSNKLKTNLPIIYDKTTATYLTYSKFLEEKISK